MRCDQRVASRLPLSARRFVVLAILGRIIVICALSACVALQTAAQEGVPSSPDPLTGTLKKVKNSGVLRIGHRENSIPFAFTGPGGQPIGYSIDLCNAIVEEVIDELGDIEIRVEYRAVTPENRFSLLISEDIDLECGSTTNNLERRKQVAFSPTIFVSGTKLLVRKNSPITGLRDLRSRTVVVTEGTTNAAA